MAAIIRVKRRNSAEPQDALLIACKRSKIDTGDEEPLTTLVKLAGTVKSQDEEAIETVTKQFANKQELQDEFKKHRVDILSKMREEAKAQSRESRYKIINCQRSLSDKKVDQDNQVTTVIDIEDSESMNKSDKEENVYVYDIYFDHTMMMNKQFSHDQQISVYPVESELVFDNDPDCEDVGVDEYKTDDENSESNYRNDYPDDSEPDSIDEDDMKLAMENLDIGEELSSEEDFAYGLNEDDVNNYGYRYAKYKAKVRKELGEDDSENEYEDCEGSEKSDYDYDDAESEDD